VGKFYGQPYFLVDLAEYFSKLVGNIGLGTLLPSKSLLNVINMFDFKYKDDFKMKTNIFQLFRDFMYVQ
jgi:hypothetical protein